MCDGFFSFLKQSQLFKKCFALYCFTFSFITIWRQFLLICCVCGAYNIEDFCREECCGKGSPYLKVSAVLTIVEY